MEGLDLAVVETYSEQLAHHKQHAGTPPATSTARPVGTPSTKSACVSYWFSNHTFEDECELNQAFIELERLGETA
jgi:hypothetical protein